MRCLILIPIVHSEADLGGAGPGLATKSAALVGERRWRLHQATVSKFWGRVAAYLGALDVRLLRIYQDGLPADGELGRRIVEEAARRDSPNYQTVLALLDKGGELRRTEDLVLMWQERENLLALVQVGTPDSTRAELYRSRRDRLLEERDRSISEAINSTLTAGEIGVLFIGAYHNVAPRLDKDISVKAAWDPERVRAYFDELLRGHDPTRLDRLAEYLCSPDTAAQAG